MSVDLLEKTKPLPTAQDHPRSEASEALRFSPVNPVIGAEVSGVDLRQPLDEATVARLRRKLVKYKVLFFRDQPITDEDQIRFSHYFGGVTPAHPINNGRDGGPAQIMENVKSQQAARQSVFTEVEKQHHRAFARARSGRGWHTDITFVANPSDISFLRNHESPESGGDTLWVNLEALYESFSPAFRSHLDGLQAIHGRDDAHRGFPPPPRADGRPTGPYLSLHPLVRVHPESGKKALFLSPGFIKYIEGYSEGESEALLTYLRNELAGRLDLQLRFRWTPNSLAVWDNRATSHWGPVDAEHFEEERIVRRTTVGASFPVGPDGFTSRQIAGDLFFVLDDY
ncbi:TauD/TfdA family dioxygenase [Sphingobium sufflavum]|uniref:TauD/TfdA dioxygenase family protein n=1 Tax=Sphingobium sufflavum TaxID=1129547 RepID=UPI001F2B297B|nr:TauD/TfdA family dioxygenase [Sphingobium sufflavum]MCE7796464.1 TauD/TfdA family dioxygenase [Sphingobium sufflavum]